MSNATSEFGSLYGMCAAVTGASSGIGRAIACEFARAGAALVLHAGHRADRLEETAQRIRAAGGTVAATFVCDFSSPDVSIGDFVDRCWHAAGNLDIWVNNAGVDNLTGAGGQLGYEAKLQRLLDVDVRATLLASRAVGRRFVEQQRGVILNIGWDQADRGMEGDSGELFSAAKNAVMGFTRALACSLAPHVRVNCIAPGWIRTEWGASAGAAWQERVLRETPLARWGEPEDVAQLARFLASPQASYITGQVICANGGAVR